MPVEFNHTIILLFFVMTFSPASKAAVKDTDLAKHEVRKQSFWLKQNIAHKSFTDKLFDVPDQLIDYLHKFNIKDGWPNRPIKSTLTAEQKKILVEALQELPQAVQDKANNRLVGIFFVKDLGGTALADYIIDEEENPVGGFIVFDELILKKKANEWATWKEKSPFKLDKSDWDLELTIENKKMDTVKSAFQFIALHELGHIISIKSGMHPDWGYEYTPESHPSRYSFSKLSWTLNKENKETSLFESIFPLRSQVGFYLGRLSANLNDVYEQLEKTNFPTLYAATNVSDDFADSFASYVHVKLLKRPYQVILTKNKKRVKMIPTCWGSKRCEEKEKILAEFLKN